MKQILSVTETAILCHSQPIEVGLERRKSIKRNVETRFSDSKIAEEVLPPHR